jgi:hypothetical protein
MNMRCWNAGENTDLFDGTNANVLLGVCKWNVERGSGVFFVSQISLFNTIISVSFFASNELQIDGGRKCFNSDRLFAVFKKNAAGFLTKWARKFVCEVDALTVDTMFKNQYRRLDTR